LSKSIGCAPWYWNYALNACIQHYQETGKALKLAVYKGLLPQLGTIPVFDFTAEI
jgi:putative transposase